MGVRQAANDRTRRNGLKLCDRRFKLDIRKNFFVEKLVSPCNELPREVMESLSLEAFKRQLDVALSAMSSLTRWCSVKGWT